MEPSMKLIVASILALFAVFSTRAADAVPVEAVALKSSAAVVLEGRSHETIDGLAISSDVSIQLTNCSDIVISACDLRSIELSGCKRVSIYNCFIHDSAHCGVQTYQTQQLLVQGCRVERVSSGVYAIESQQIQVVGNFARNMKGPFPRGQMTQFDNVTGAGNVIRGNYAINEYGQNHSEDVINIYMSSGSAGSPIVIENNYVTADPLRGNEGMSKSGSGIMLGDQGGAHEVCRGNVVVSAGQVGIGVAGGTAITVEKNVIYGAKSDVSNNGLYAWNQSGKPCSHVSITGNRVRWMNQAGEDNSWWKGGGVQELRLSDNHFADAGLPAELPEPPSRAPMPPQLWSSPNAQGGGSVARVPWKVE
jgi:hypothetical protein